MVFLEEYTLLDELGQGGYATIYKVRHNELGYIRAIRVLNATIARGEDDPIYKKFLEECRLLLRLGNGNHPNIVHIYQPLIKSQKAIVEMDFVDGKDLFHFLEEKHSFVDIKDVLKLLTDIGGALAYCHEDIYKYCMDKDKDKLKDDPQDGKKVLLDAETKQRLINKYRVIHNDIHSGNIIRREDGTYVLLDFGLAIEGDSVIRSSRRKNGAPEFKAPEKWENDSVLTTQSDIYSFGVVLYEYLTGRVPFIFDKNKSNPAEAEYLLSQAHKEQQPPKIFDLRKAAFESSHPGEIYEKDYPDWFEELVMKCLSKSIDDRFTNGKELYSFAVEHIKKDTERQVKDLKQQIHELQSLVSSLRNDKNNSNKDFDIQVSEFKKKINELSSRKDALSKQLQDLQSENLELKKDCESLKLNISNCQKEKEGLEQHVIDVTRKLDNLYGENERLTKQNQRFELRIDTYKKRWMLCFASSLFFLFTTGFAAVLYFTKESSSGTETIAVPIGDNKVYMPTQGLDLKSVEEIQNEILAKNDEINSLLSKISELKREVATLKSTNSQSLEGYTQADIDERNKTIKQLNTEISKLRKQMNEKDRLIEALNEQIGVN